MSKEFMNALSSLARALERKLVQRDELVITLKSHAYDNFLNHMYNDPDFMRMIDGDPHTTTDEIKFIGIKFTRGKN
jgi:hypothetical protein